MITTGIDLAVQRMRARITQKVLSYHVGVSRARISHIEQQTKVTPSFAKRYRAALREARRHA